MSTTGSVRGMSEFEDLCRGHQGYSTNMAELYDKVSCDKQTFHRHGINFKETLRRLKKKVKETIQELELHSERDVIEFTIGKTFVKARPGVTFNTMRATTWSLGGGINGRWQDYKNEKYDGLVVIGCIERDTIPEYVKEANKSIEMNQQIYALALEQGLIQHFSLHKPDKRLRNKSYDTGCKSTTTYKGGIVYVAYKLELEPSYSDDETETDRENVHGITIEERQLAMNRLKLRLEREGLFFQAGIPIEGASFFEACSSQLERVGITNMDPINLRNMVIQYLKLRPPDSEHTANFTKERWGDYLEELNNGTEVVEDVVLERTAKLLDRQIIIYFTEYPDAIGSTSINDQAAVNGTPLLLGRHTRYFQGICTEITATEQDPAAESSAHKILFQPENEPRQMKRPVGVDNDSGASSIKQFKQSSKPRIVGDTNVNAMDDLGKHVSSGYNTNVASAKSVSPGMSSTERNNIPQSSHNTQQKPKSILKKETNQNILAANLSKKESSVNFTADSNQQKKETNLNVTTESNPPNSSSLPSSLNEQHSATVRAATPTKGPAVKRKPYAAEEKKLILKSYKQQRIKSDFDVLADTVYSQRHVELPREIRNLYETLPHQARKERIRRFINDCKRGKRAEEKDPAIKDLIAEIWKTN